jgi:hypothetical protein
MNVLDVWNWQSRLLESAHLEMDLRKKVKMQAHLLVIPELVEERVYNQFVPKEKWAAWPWAPGVDESLQPRVISLNLDPSRSFNELLYRFCMETAKNSTSKAQLERLYKTGKMLGKGPEFVIRAVQDFYGLNIKDIINEYLRYMIQWTHALTYVVVMDTWMLTMPAQTTEQQQRATQEMEKWAKMGKSLRDHPNRSESLFSVCETVDHSRTVTWFYERKDNRIVWKERSEMSTLAPDKAAPHIPQRFCHLLKRHEWIVAS